MPRPRKNRYLEPDDLARELEKSRPPNPPTQELCAMLRSIAEHLLGSPKYRGYAKDLQQDMVSAALIKCLKNVKNWDPSKGASSFNYFTRCCEHAFWDFLKVHYRQLNIKREATLRAADEVARYSPQLAASLRRRLEETAP